MSSLSSCFFVPVSVFFDNCVFPQIGRKSVEYLHVCQDHTEKKNVLEDFMMIAREALLIAKLRMRKEYYMQLAARNIRILSKRDHSEHWE